MLEIHWFAIKPAICIMTWYRHRSWLRQSLLNHTDVSDIPLTYKGLNKWSTFRSRRHYQMHVREGEWIQFGLTHWGRVTHICVSKLTIIGSDNGLSPERRQAIIWTNAGIFLIGPLGTNFSEILIEKQTFSLKKIRLKMSSAKCFSFRLGLDVFNFTVVFCWVSKWQ